MDVAYLVSLGGGVATIVGTVTAVGVVVTKRLTAIHDQNSEQLRKQAEFNSDWYGNAARPGVDAQPGMMERVKSIEKELRPNGGSSLRDAVNRVETRQIEVERRITDIERRPPV